MNGISSVTDSPRPGQAHPVVTPEAIAAVEAIVKEIRRVTVNEIASHLHMSHGSAHYIVRRSQWPRGLRRRSTAARLLSLWVRIPPGAWMFGLL